MSWLLPDRPGSTSQRYFVTAAVWMVVAVTAGLLAAIELVAPDALGNIPWLVFGRLRPIHTNLMLLGWVPAGLIGGVLYLVPRVLGTTRAVSSGRRTKSPCLPLGLGCRRASGM